MKRAPQPGDAPGSTSVPRSTSPPRSDCFAKRAAPSALLCEAG